MITTVITDFSRVILFPKDKTYIESLNKLYREKQSLPDFSFHDHYEFNDLLLKYFDEIKDNISLHIFTTGNIQELPVVKTRIEGIFKTIFSVQDIGYKKTDPEAYEYILKRLDKTADETVFIDDTLKNIETARQVGIHTILYKDNATLFYSLSNLLTKD